MRALICFAIMLFYSLSICSQVEYTTKTKLKLDVNGTSTIHDWVMSSTNGDCKVSIVLDDQGNIKEIKSMSFKMGVKSLVSGKKQMDNNAYKALKADQNPSIIASLKSAKVTNSGTISKITASIDLTISGKKREVPIDVNFKKINVDSYQVTLSKKLKMSDFNVEPPTFMMGAVKTGDDIDLKFDFILTK